MSCLILVGAAATATIVGVLDYIRSSSRSTSATLTSLAPPTTSSWMHKSSVADSKVERPFPMPIHGGSRFDIFQPLYDIPDKALGKELLAPPEDFLRFYKSRLEWLDTITVKNSDSSLQDRARFTYLEMLKSHLTGTVFNDAEHSVGVGLRQPKNSLGKKFNFAQREQGLDWTYLGDTMTGWARIKNVADLLKKVIVNEVPGDYIETGVWRGGSSMFARAILRTYNEADKRKSFVCDSFRGLPPGEKELSKNDIGWDKSPYLEVSENIVAQGFRKYGLLDSGVVFAKGFFNETMPPLSKHIEKLAIMRLDGDMYESTVDVLYPMYAKLSVGGYVIMDDWSWFPSRTAVEDFFKVHGMNETIIDIDSASAYWKKTRDVQVQYWRYEQSKFT